jgi:hypothetical protein
MTETCSVKYDFNKLADFVGIRAYQLGCKVVLIDGKLTQQDAKHTYEDYNYN